MENKIIKLFTLIIIVIVSISCGKTMTGPEDGGGGDNTSFGHKRNL